ncbi:hypothetical protein [Acinetobacter phage vB_AbaP_ABWU2101]|nr:hypothetical protein [Acinetobacter phage vB_AbaP_ABWU2101]
MKHTEELYKHAAAYKAAKLRLHPTSPLNGE